MNVYKYKCSICSNEADWVRTRMPNAEQMSYLCNRHYQSLQHNNALLASYYDDIASVAPMQMSDLSLSEEGRRQNMDDGFVFKEPYNRT